MVRFPAATGSPQLCEKRSELCASLNAAGILNARSEVRVNEFANCVVNLLQMRSVVQRRFRIYLFKTAVWQKPFEMAGTLHGMNRVTFGRKDQSRAGHKSQTLAPIFQASRERQAP